MSRGPLQRLVLSLLFGSLAGCVGGGGLPVTHYYTLRAPDGGTGTAAVQPGAEGLAIGVQPLAVDPPYDQDRLVYRTGRSDAEIGFYAYHRWASPLGRLLAVALAEGLRGTEGIAAIEPSRTAGDYDARLEGRLRYLEEVDTSTGPEVRLALELALRADQGEILWSSTFVASAAGAAQAVPQVVDLIQRAFEEVLQDAAEEIGAVIDRLGASGAP